MAKRVNENCVYCGGAAYSTVWMLGAGRVLVCAKHHTAKPVVNGEVR